MWFSNFLEKPFVTDKITDMMTFAKMLPFTDGAVQAEQLRQALLG
jgi:hypothetical protein